MQNWNIQTFLNKNHPIGILGVLIGVFGVLVGVIDVLVGVFYWDALNGALVCIFF